MARLKGGGRVVSHRQATALLDPSASAAGHTQCLGTASGMEDDGRDVPALLFCHCWGAQPCRDDRQGLEAQPRREA